MKKMIICILLIFLMAGCSTKKEETAETKETSENEITEKEEVNMKLWINEEEVSVIWQDNESVEALKDIVKENDLQIPMSMYGGFEQVGPLGTSLPRGDSQTTTDSGDIVLYSGSQLVVFYGSNSWAYTRLGHITDQSRDDMAALLGQGDVAITLTVEAAK